MWALVEQTRKKKVDVASGPRAILAGCLARKDESVFLTHCLTRALQVNAHGLATVFGDRSRTWREVEERVARLAAGFKSLGLKREERVAILALNSDRYLETCFAVAWAGGVFVPVSFRLKPTEIAEILSDADPCLLLVDDFTAPHLSELRAGLPNLCHVIFAGEQIPPVGTVDYEELLLGSSRATDDERGNDATAAIFYTGGTTGRPRGAMLTHNNLVANALNSLSVIETRQPFVYLHAAPMFHIADGGIIGTVTMRGATQVFVPGFDPARVLSAIESHGVTHLLLASTMLRVLTDYPELTDYDLSSLRVVIYGASPIAEPVLLKAVRTFSECEFVQGYGMTETSPLITLLEADHHNTKKYRSEVLRSAGQPVVTAEVRIVNDQGETMPPGETGEVVTRGPHVMKGYWRSPEETNEILRDGWLHTGDVGYMDKGFLYIVDRKKDVIIRGGENVFSPEVEEVLQQHPAVVMAAVIGVPSDEWGETVHAIVVVEDVHAVTPEHFIEHCQASLAGFKCPTGVTLRDSPLPRSGVGKVLKTELRAPFWEGRRRRVN